MNNTLIETHSNESDSVRAIVWLTVNGQWTVTYHPLSCMDELRTATQHPTRAEAIATAGRFVRPEVRAARATLKAINRHVKKEGIFSGGRAFGVDWPTWWTCYPQMAQTFQRCGSILTGREGNFMPRPFASRG